MKWVTTTLLLLALATVALAGGSALNACLQNCSYGANIVRRGCRITGASVATCKAQADAWYANCVATQCSGL
jgi:hypothetical protein